jgi:hypothetical protein
MAIFIVVPWAGERVAKVERYMSGSHAGQRTSLSQHPLCRTLSMCVFNVWQAAKSSFWNRACLEALWRAPNYTRHVKSAARQNFICK